MKIYFKALFYITIIILGSTLVLTFLHYFDIINNNITNITKLVIAIASLLIGGYKVGKQAQKRGWLEGIKLAATVIVLLLLLSWIFNLPIDWKNLIYYLIITITSMAGAMFGISKKNKP